MAMLPWNMISPMVWPSWGDRKSTRLNSSHLVISYAVFCLKKKNHTHVASRQRQHRHILPQHGALMEVALLQPSPDPQHHRAAIGTLLRLACGWRYHPLDTH